MKITLTLEQLESLLWQQKYSCKKHFETIWKDSEIRRQLKVLDPEEKVLNKMHEVRDKIVGAEFPDDYKVLAKYEIKN